MSVETPKRIIFDLNSTIIGVEDVKIGIPTTQSQRLKVMSQDLKISAMKTSGQESNEDLASINVMDYFKDAPAAEIKREDISLSQKLKNLLICN